MVTMRLFVGALMGGVLTGLGGGAFLGAQDRAVGALLFSVGMFGALALGFPLFIGRCAGYLCCKKRNYRDLLLVVLGNLLGAAVTGLIFGMAVSTWVDQNQAAKMTQPFLSTLARGTFCGMILYVAAEAWKRLPASKPVGVLLGVAAFIVAGFENSVADVFYFAAAFGQGGAFEPRTLPFVLAAVLGNIIGPVLLCLAQPERGGAPEKPGEAK